MWFPVVSYLNEKLKGAIDYLSDTASDNQAKKNKKTVKKQYVSVESACKTLIKLLLLSEVTKTEAAVPFFVCGPTPGCRTTVNNLPVQVAPMGQQFSVQFFSEYTHKTICVAQTTCGVNSASGPLSYSFYDSATFGPLPSWINSIPGMPQIEGIPDKNSPASTTVAAQLSCVADTCTGSNQFKTVTATINVVPSLTFSAPSSYTYTEMMSYTIPGLIISTPAANCQIMVQFANSGDGTIANDATGTAQGLYYPNNGIFVITGPVPTALTLLGRMKITPAPYVNYNTSLTVSFNDFYNNIATSVIDLYGTAVNHEPQFVGPAPKVTVAVGQSLSANLAPYAMDPDIPTQLLYYNITPIAAWYSINASNGTAVFTPSKAERGINTLSFEVSDGQFTVREPLQLDIVASLVVSGVPTIFQFTEETSSKWPAISISSLQPTVTVQILISPAHAGTFQTNATVVPTSNFNPSTGIYTVTGSPGQLNALFADFSFNPSPDFDKQVSVTTVFSDGVDEDVVHNFVMSCNAVPDAPRQIANISNIDINPGQRLTVNADVFRVVDAGSVLQYIANCINCNSTTLPAFMILGGTQFSISPRKTDLGYYLIQLLALASGLTSKTTFAVNITSALALTLQQIYQSLPIGYASNFNPAQVQTNQATVSLTMTALPGASLSFSTSNIGLTSSNYNPNMRQWSAQGPVQDVMALAFASKITINSTSNTLVEVLFTADDGVNPPASLSGYMILSDNQVAFVGAPFTRSVDPRLLANLVAPVQMASATNRAGGSLSWLNYQNSMISSTPNKNQVMTDMVEVVLVDGQQNMAKFRFPLTVQKSIALDYFQSVQLYASTDNSTSLPSASLRSAAEPVTVHLVVQPSTAAALLASANQTYTKNSNGISYSGTRAEVLAFLQSLQVQAASDTIKPFTISTVTEDSVNGPVESRLEFIPILPSYEVEIAQPFILPLPALAKGNSYYFVSGNNQTAPWINGYGQNQVLSGTPSNADLNTWPIGLEIRDNLGNVLRSFSFVINVISPLLLQSQITGLNVLEDGQVTLYGISVKTNQPTVSVRVSLSDVSAGNLTSSQLPSISFDQSSNSLLITGPQTEVNFLLNEVVLRMTPFYNKPVKLLFIATDKLNPASQLNLPVRISHVNHPPELKNLISTLQRNFEGPLRLVIPDNVILDPDETDELSWSVTSKNKPGLPKGCTFDPRTRTLSWNPKRSDIGTHTFTLTATDRAGARAFVDFNIIFTGTTWFWFGIYLASSTVGFIGGAYKWYNRRHLFWNHCRSKQYTREPETLTIDSQSVSIPMHSIDEKGKKQYELKKIELRKPDGKPLEADVPVKIVLDREQDEVLITSDDKAAAGNYKLRITDKTKRYRAEVPLNIVYDQNRVLSSMRDGVHDVDSSNSEDEDDKAVERSILETLRASVGGIFSKTNPAIPNPQSPRAPGARV